jgi:hypothetical protein
MDYNRLRLSASWELTSIHPSSRYGTPVLVRIETGEAYGTGDLVKLFPSYGLIPAADAVRRLARARSLAGHGKQMVESFLGEEL